nr:PhnD/SsuA/transferrin family substrate-binding protein [Gammaproteobacteria bacterium]NIT52015.1 PhnD/SsuA/transferrin family substrate-binding protein [candidate division Zixibacteria bacterium]NIW39949.1 PhnD/SsuA/transferrin family substrate-binding protein [candidate division Zixibacteria bacterium]
KSLAISPNIPEHLFVANSNIPLSTKRKIQEIFLQLMASEEGRAALHSIKSSVTGIVRVKDSDYDYLRRIID